METGETLGHYTISDRLGAGGMGEVWAAVDGRLGRRIAIKILPPRLASDPDRLRRFEREAHAVAALDHPHIVTVFSIEEDRGIRFMTMQLVSGQPLSECIPRDGLPLDRLLELAIPIVDAIATAHEHGIVHRDVKPANVMVAESGRPFVLDFGLAKLRQPDVPPDAETALAPDSSTEIGQVLGSAPYMSPEQAEGRAVDHRSDIFAIGVLLYEMATGHRPFSGENRLGVMEAIANRAPVPLVERRPGLPEALCRIVDRALEKDPSRRYQATADMRVELEALRRDLASGGGQARVGASRPSRRQWLWAATAGLAMVALAAGVAQWMPAASETLPFEARDWILVTDFDNLTGEEVFDRSLQTALTVSIDQSPHVNVVSRGRIRRALARMERGDVEVVDEEAGREVAEREDVGVVLVPAISRVGSTYVLTALLQDARSGDTLAAEEVRAEGQDDILGALDALTRRIRERLGEAIVSIDQRGRRLADVTTSSLDALRQYSLGTDALGAGEFREAGTYYRAALAIDPAFTAAKASLGMLHVDSVRKGLDGFDADEGRRLLSEAVTDVEQLTDRERFSIQAFHAWAVEDDVEAAEDYYRAGVAVYPDLSAYHNNLGWLYQATGRYEEATAAYEEAIRIDPYLMLTYDGLTYLYANQLNRPADAERVARQQIDRNPDHAGAWDALGWALLGQAEYAPARDAFAKAVELDPRAEVDWFRLASAQRMLGNLRAALDALARLREVNPGNGWAVYQQGVVHSLMGEEQAARAAFEDFLVVPLRWVEEFPDSAQSFTALALARARLGELDAARRAIERAIAADPTAHFSLAQAYAVAGAPSEALDHLEQAIEGGYRDFIWMRVHPDFITLYDNRRFQALTSSGGR